MYDAINGALTLFVLAILCGFVCVRESPEALLRISIWARSRCESLNMLKAIKREQERTQRRDLGMERGGEER